MFDSLSSNSKIGAFKGSNTWAESFSTPTSTQKSKFFQDIQFSQRSTITNNNNNNNNNEPKKFKQSPTQIANQAVNELLPDAHVLPYTWTIFFHSRKTRQPVKSEESTITDATTPPVEATNQPQVATSVDSFLQTTKEIEFPEVCTKDTFNGLSKTTITIASVEQLWEALSLLKRTNDLPVGSELFIFKSGVEPVWEDKVNAKGGRWMFKFSRRSQPQQYGNDSSNEQQQQQQNQQQQQPGKIGGEDIVQIRKRNALIWERLVLRVLGGSLFAEENINGELLLNDISGLVLSIRRDEDIISIWNTNLCFDKRFQENYFKSIFNSNPELKNPIKDTFKSIENSDDDEEHVKLSNRLLFNDRRMVCSAVLKTIREVDAVIKGGDVLVSQDINSTERVYGVNFEYRLHADNSRDNENDGKHDSHHNHHHHHHHHHHYNNNSRNNRNHNNSSNNNNNNNNSNNNNNNNNTSNNNSNSRRYNSTRYNKNHSGNNAKENNNNEVELGVDKIFESGSFSNLGRSRRRRPENGGEEHKNLMSFGNRRRMQNLQKSSNHQTNDFENGERE